MIWSQAYLRVASRESTCNDLPSGEALQLHFLDIMYSQPFDPKSTVVLWTEPLQEGAEIASWSADDPQLAEFLQLMQPRRAGTIWSNEDAELAQKGSRIAKAEAPTQADRRAKISSESGSALQKTRASQHAEPAPRSSAWTAEIQPASASAGEHVLLSCMRLQRTRFIRDILTCVRDGCTRLSAELCKPKAQETQPAQACRRKR